MIRSPDPAPHRQPSVVIHGFMERLNFNVRAIFGSWLFMLMLIAAFSVFFADLLGW